jgi:asparagine synthase (glutamine-hydrolysing)
VSRASRQRHVCIVVQNLSVPFDRRVWLECLALVDAGYAVSVVCPRGPGEPARRDLEGVHIVTYRAFPPVTRQVMFLAEYAYSILCTFLGLLRVWRRAPFRVVQVCNPPDVLWVATLPFQVLGAKLVYDQHDLCPELYLSRFAEPARFPHRALLLAERVTYLLASRVISTNESYRRVALTRGRKRPDRVTVVRTGPDPDRLRRGEPEPALRRGFDHLLVYIGVMGPQDGVDMAIRALEHIVRVRGRADVGMTLIGDGDAAPELRRLTTELGLDDFVHFTGRLPDEAVRELMSTADVGLSPDPKNALNDVSTMNKTMEYMAFELPVVAFDLVETRVSAGDAAVYAPPNLVEEYGDAVLDLLADDARRAEMGKVGRERVEKELAWRTQVPAYVGVYDGLTRG